MNRRINTLLLIISLSIISCQQSSVDKAAQSLTDERLMDHISVLSSDEFRGRAPGTGGEEKTVEYLVDRYEEFGITPGMPDGSYVQDVPLTGQKTAEDAVLTITRNGQVLQRYNYSADFMAWPANMSEDVNVRNAELVYVGYGIQAPEENWDDFKVTDVEGKILVVKNNDPSSNPELFKGEARLYYGRYGYKYEKAREMGALGVLIVHTSPSAGYPWNVVSSSWGMEQFYLKGNSGMENSPTAFNGWLTREASAQLFESAGLDLEKQLEAAESRDFEPVPLEGLRASLDLEAGYRDINAKNVVGLIEGNDPDLKDEYLVLTAHHDHLGTGDPVEGDSVYNGALDNASGTAALLELARAYKQVQPQLKRSVIVLAVGAEEKGLLGSQYYANNPTVHPGKMTANINLDGMNVFGRTRDIVAIGYGRSTIDEILKAEADERGRTVKPDPQPDKGYYYRSDHFSFAKIGVPALYPDAGTEFIGKPEGYGEQVVDEYINNNYHSVSDEVTEEWDLSGAVEDARLIFEVGYRIINDGQMQQWKPGDEFEATRKKMLEEAGN